MKSKVFTLFFILWSICLMNSMPGNCQNLHQVMQQKMDADEFAMDPFGYLYFLKGNNLSRYDTNFHFLNRYSPTDFSRIHSVDVSTAFKILVFKSESSSLLWLDNSLSPILSEVVLTQIGIQQALLACNGPENSFWVFDMSGYQVKRYNFQLQLLSSGENLSSVTTHRIPPTRMLVFDRNLYILVPEVGILVLDSFGNYLKTLPFPHARDFTLVQHIVFILEDSKLLLYHVKTLDLNSYTLFHDSRKVIAGPGQCWILGIDSVYRYQLP